MTMQSRPTVSHGAGWRPLAGVKLLDFSALLPGPMAGGIFADLGAEVIKIEPLTGDAVRHRGVLAPIHRSANRSKSSLLINLKKPEAATVLGRLARWGDAALESFRPGVAAKLGIDHEALSRHNARIITCSLSGYGQTGPWRDRPGHDLNFLAAAGAFAFPGHWTGRPRRSGLPIADLCGGYTAAIALLAALRERDATGKGTALDIALMDATLYAVAMRHGLERDRFIADYPYPTNDLFLTSDGREIALGVGTEDSLWENLRRALSSIGPAILDARYDSDALRREHGDELFALLETTLAQRPASEWIALFEEFDVPASLCVAPSEAVESEQITSRGFVQTVDGHHLSTFPANARGALPEIRWPAPDAGEGTRPVLRMIGLDEVEIEGLLQSGTVAERAAAL